MAALHISYHDGTQNFGSFAGLKRARPELYQNTLARFNAVADQLRRLPQSLDEADPDLLFFSDSTSIRCAEGETPCRSLDAYLARATGRRVCSLQDGAYSFLLYNELFALLPQAKKPIPALITVNLRSFSEEWLLRPSYLFPDIRAVIRCLTGELPFAAALEQYFLCTATDFMRNETLAFKNRTSGMAEGPPQTIGHILEGRHRDVRLSLEFFYCYSPGQATACLADLLRPFRTLAAKGYIPCAYLTPINYEAILELCSHPAQERYAANVHCLAEALRQECAVFADCSNLLGVDAFMDLSEHLFAPAKEALANRLAHRLAPLCSAPPGAPPQALRLDNSLLRAITPQEIEAAAKLVQAERMTT